MDDRSTWPGGHTTLHFGGLKSSSTNSIFATIPLNVHPIRSFRRSKSLEQQCRSLELGKNLFVQPLGWVYGIFFLKFC